MNKCTYSVIILIVMWLLVSMEGYSIAQERTDTFQPEVVLYHAGDLQSRRIEAWANRHTTLLPTLPGLQSMPIRTVRGLPTYQSLATSDTNGEVAALIGVAPRYLPVNTTLQLARVNGQCPACERTQQSAYFDALYEYATTETDTNEIDFDTIATRVRAISDWANTDDSETPTSTTAAYPIREPVYVYYRDNSPGAQRTLCEWGIETVRRCVADNIRITQILSNNRDDVDGENDPDDGQNPERKPNPFSTNSCVELGGVIHSFNEDDIRSTTQRVDPTAMPEVIIGHGVKTDLPGYRRIWFCDELTPVFVSGFDYRPAITDVDVEEMMNFVGRDLQTNHEDTVPEISR